MKVEFEDIYVTLINGERPVAQEGRRGQMLPSIQQLEKNYLNPISNEVVSKIDYVCSLMPYVEESTEILSLFSLDEDEMNRNILWGTERKYDH